MKTIAVPHTHPSKADLERADKPEKAEREKLTTGELRLLVETREQELLGHLSGLRSEFTTLDDVTVAGEPLPSYVRRRPFETAGGALAAGASVGLLLGLWARARRRPEADGTVQIAQAYFDDSLDDAAYRVRGGLSGDEAVRAMLRDRGPVVLYRPSPPAEAVRGPIRESVDLAIKTALGFGVKMGLDLLAKKLTGQREVFDAVQDADAHPPPPAPPPAY